jgi:hypothetical protein
MPSDPLPNKREVMLALLAEASVFIHLDPRGTVVRVPPWFKNQAQLVLQVGLNMAVPIPDLDVSEEGIKCTLSFNRRPFFCSIPWKSVFGLVGEGGPGLVWPDDVPVEVAAQVQKQSGQKVPAKKSEARAHLRAVGSEPAEPGPAAEPAPAVEGADAVTPPARPSPVAALAETAEETESSGADAESAETRESVRPSPGPKGGSKRELPSYLRVVK